MSAPLPATLIGICIWLGAIGAVAGELPDISRIAIPDVTESDFPMIEVGHSSITLERRNAVSARIAKAFSQAESILIASLEPNHPELLKMHQPEMTGRLRKGLLDGHRYYGSLTLNDKIIQEFRDSIISSIETAGTPRLGFCWSPRHAIILRKAKAPDIVITICYQCGGMRFKDGQDTLTFYPPHTIRKVMDDLLDKHKTPRSTPIEKLPAKGGTHHPAHAADPKFESQ